MIDPKMDPNRVNRVSSRPALPAIADALANAYLFWGSLVVLLAMTLGALFLVSTLITRPTPPADSEPVAPPIPSQVSATVVDGNVKIYSLPNPDAGLMQPALAPSGTVWAGEMAANRLAELDPATGQVRSWQPPQGMNTIMATQVDTQGRVYFSEQAANYIGRFDPTTQSFKTFSLPQANGHTSGPQDLRFDASGKLWVTLASAGSIARLDPVTGALDTWPVPAPAQGIDSNPWALALSSSGKVWFGLLSGGAVGSLDPTTGQVTLIHLANTHAQIFSMAADGQGRVYFSEMQAGKVGVIQTATGQVQELDVPTVLGDPTSLYAVACADGDAWFASSGANALIRLDPVKGTFTFYKLPLPTSVPYGLAIDKQGHVWYAADDPAGNYIGELTPQPWS